MRLDLLKRLGKAHLGVFSIVWLLTASPAFCNVIDTVPVVPPGGVALRDPQFDGPISRGVDLTFTDQYEESVQIFDRLRKAYPQHPAPYFFLAAAYDDWMTAVRTNRFEEQAAQNIEEAIIKGNAMLRREQDSWVQFYVGAAYGYRALLRFRKQDWISAYLDARKGVQHLKEALEREPRLYDAYLGLGIYHYWRTAKSEFFRFIAFWIPDKRELGLRQLRFAFEHGRYAVHEAGYDLVAAYYDAGQNQKAMETLDQIIQGKRNAGLTDLYYKGRLLIRFKKWHAVEQTFRELLKALQSRDIVSVGYQVECEYWIAAALAAQNKKAEARAMVAQALRLGEKRNGLRELEGPYESFREINLKLFGLRYRLSKTGADSVVSPP